MLFLSKCLSWVRTYGLYFEKNLLDLHTYLKNRRLRDHWTYDHLQLLDIVRQPW